MRKAGIWFVSLLIIALLPAMPISRSYGSAGDTKALFSVPGARPISLKQPQIVSTMVATVTPAPTASPTPIQPHEDLISEQTYANHSYPLNTIPGGAVDNALKWSNQYIPDGIPDGMNPGGRQRLGANIALTATRWTSFGPQPESEYPTGNLVSGRVTAIAVSPTSTSTVYAGMSGGGVWKSTNCCGPNATFTATTDDPAVASSVIGAIAIAATSPYTIYAGTGEANNCSDCLGGRGVLRSTDGGTSWLSLGKEFFTTSPGYPLSISSMAVDTHNPSIVAAGAYVFNLPGAITTTSGLYLSTNNGTTWSQCLIPSSVAPAGYIQKATEVIINPDTNPSTLYVALGQGTSGTTPTNPANGIYKATLPLSSGCPTNWSRLLDPSTLFGGLAAGRIQMAMAASNHSVLYAVIGDVGDQDLTGDTAIRGVVHTSNAGTTWDVRSTLNSFPNHDSDHMYSTQTHLYIKVDPANPNILYVGDVDLYRSIDGGTTYTDLDDFYEFHEDQHALAFLDTNGSGHTNIIVGTDGGLWSFFWHPTQLVGLNHSISSIQFYAGDLTPGFASDPNAIALGGAQDNGTAVYTASNTNPYLWTQPSSSLIGGDGFYTAIEPNSKQNAYFEFKGGQLMCSTSGAGGFYTPNCRGDWINQNDNTSFSTPFILDHLNCQTTCQHIVLGTNRVWESTNGGLTHDDWHIISPNLGCKWLACTGVINALAFAPQNTAVILAGTNNGNLEYTYNADTSSMANWTNLNGDNHVFPNRSVTSIAVTPDSAITTASPVMPT